MKKLKLLLVIVLAATFITQAQAQRRTVEERVKMTMDRISDSLKLDAKELPATTTAFTDYYTAQNKLREGLADGTRPDKTQMDKLTSDRDAVLQKIWTADQLKRFKEMEANMRQRGGGGQRPPGQ